MDRYSHTVIGEQATALDALPDLSSPLTRTQLATGTDGKSLPPGLPTLAASAALRTASHCTEDSNVKKKGPRASAYNHGASGTSLHQSASKCTTGVDGNRTHQAPRQQRFNGFEGRGTHQASGHPQGILMHRSASHCAGIIGSCRSRTTPVDIAVGVCL